MAAPQDMSMSLTMMILLNSVFLTYCKVIGGNLRKAIIKMRVLLQSSFLHSSSTLKIKISLILRSMRSEMFYILSLCQLKRILKERSSLRSLILEYYLTNSPK
jgi:hypothetical protein